MTNDPVRIGGLILAGGRSRRFGGDKSLARLHGQTLLETAAMALSEACHPVGVSAPLRSASAALAAEMGLCVISDRPGDPEGPLAGISAGLAWVTTQGGEWLFVRPVDTPFLPVDLPRRLLDRLGSAAGAMAALCVTAHGPQPLCSLWSVRAHPDLARTLAAGNHPSVQAYLKAIDAVSLWMDDGSAFANINRPDDLTAAAVRPR